MFIILYRHLLLISEEKFIIAVLPLMIPVAISSVVTAYYYLRAIIILKSYPATFKKSLKQAARYLYLYSFMNILTVTGPGLVFCIACGLAGKVIPELRFYVDLLQSLAGFGNSAIYLIQKRNGSRGRAESEISLSTNA